MVVRYCSGSVLTCGSVAVVVSHYRALFSLFVCFTLAPPKVNQWDRLLMENAERITDLNGEVERVKADQQVVFRRPKNHQVSHSSL